MVCDSLNDVVPNRRVNHEDVRQADPQKFGTPEAGYQAEFLSRLVMMTTECKEL
jgi:hypothetical protein